MHKNIRNNFEHTEFKIAFYSKPCNMLRMTLQRLFQSYIQRFNDHIYVVVHGAAKTKLNKRISFVIISPMIRFYEKKNLLCNTCWPKAHVFTIQFTVGIIIQNIVKACE